MRYKWIVCFIINGYFFRENMKIVHSFWSKPMIGNKGEMIGSHWRHPKFFMMSWALSCLTFKDNYGDIELVTDKLGYQLLIERLKLPYTSVKVELDCLNHYPSSLWAIGKLYSYKIQNEPFLHVDGDVYLWGRFGDLIENAALVSQQMDLDEGYYSNAIENLRSNDFFLPQVMELDLFNSDRIESCNAGVLGGNDLDFIGNYCAEAFNFIDKNSNRYNRSFNGTHYALLYEQYLFSCMARSKKKKIEFYLDYDLKQKDDFVIGDISSFLNKYKYDKRFVHMYSSRKGLIDSCYELSNQIELEFPNYYQHINNLFK